METDWGNMVLPLLLSFYETIGCWELWCHQNLVHQLQVPEGDWRLHAVGSGRGRHRLLYLVSQRVEAGEKRLVLLPEDLTGELTYVLGCLQVVGELSNITGISLKSIGDFACVTLTHLVQKEERPHSTPLWDYLSSEASRLAEMFQSHVPLRNTLNSCNKCVELKGLVCWLCRFSLHHKADWSSDPVSLLLLEALAGGSLLLQEGLWSSWGVSAPPGGLSGPYHEENDGGWWGDLAPSETNVLVLETLLCLEALQVSWER